MQYQSALTTLTLNRYSSYIELKYYVKFTDVPELYILFSILSINIWIKYCVYTYSRKFE